MSKLIDREKLLDVLRHDVECYETSCLNVGRLLVEVRAVIKMIANQPIVDDLHDRNEIKREAFLSGVEASKTIEWTHEQEEIERVLKEWGY